MKKLLISLAFGVFLSLGALAQEEGEDTWIYKISHLPTENCVDSVTCYDQVLVELNMNYLPDSTQMVFTIGNTPGGDQIFRRELLKSEDIFSQADVSQDSVGNAVVSLGEYLVGESFFVDMQIDPSQE